MTSDATDLPATSPAPRGPLVIRLPRERQLTVIVVSFAVFFGIVTYSARRLLRGMRR